MQLGIANEDGKSGRKAPQFEKPERLGYDLFRDFASLLEG